MSVSSELNVARKKLSEFLGSQIKMYYSYMKLWFSGETTKEEFDVAARNLLQPDGIRLHNDFLLAILNRCDIPSEPSNTVFTAKDSVTLQKASKTKLIVKKEKTKKKTKVSRPNFEHRFLPVNPISYAPSAVSKEIQEDETLGLCSRELTLPDIPMLHGRMFLIAWDTGLEDVEDVTVRLMQQAVEWILKSIIEKMLCRRNGYKLRDGCFKYAVGCQPVDPYLQKTHMVYDCDTNSEVAEVSQQAMQVPVARPLVEMGEDEAAFHLSCGRSYSSSNHPINMYDLLDTLQVFRNTLPSHTVYATNMERVLAKLWHTCHEEITQDNISKQEVSIKQQIAVQQHAFVHIT